MDTIKLSQWFMTSSDTEKGRYSKPETPLLKHVNIVQVLFQRIKKTSLIHCECYSDTCFYLFAQSKNIEVNFEDFTENDKLYLLMNNSNAEDILAKNACFNVQKKETC